MLVKDLLKDKQRDVVTIQPTDRVDMAMARLLENKISCLPVVNAGGDLVGIISDKDVFKAAYEHDREFKQKAVGDLMSTDLIIGLLDDEIEYIAGIMTNNRIRHVPIMDNGKMVNLLSVGDIVKAQMRDMKTQNRYLWMYIDGTYPG